MVRTLFVAGLCLLLAGIPTACSRWSSNEGAYRVAAADPAASPETLRAQLEDLMRQYLENESRRQSRAKEELVEKRPYYFKEYSVYPGESPRVDIELRESESRSAPYVADVSVEKTRFATRLHRNRTEARADGNFLRDTGTETITFELRSGHWTRVGTLFVADKTEEYINGEWVPTREEAMRTVAADDEPGWWGRTWSRVTNIF
jgi:hypothetical protein